MSLWLVFEIQLFFIFREILVRFSKILLSFSDPRHQDYSIHFWFHAKILTSLGENRLWSCIFFLSKKKWRAIHFSNCSLIVEQVARLHSYYGPRICNLHVLWNCACFKERSHIQDEFYLQIEHFQVSLYDVVRHYQSFWGVLTTFWILKRQSLMCDRFLRDKGQTRTYRSAIGITKVFEGHRRVHIRKIRKFCTVSTKRGQKFFRSVYRRTLQLTHCVLCPLSPNTQALRVYIIDALQDLKDGINRECDPLTGQSGTPTSVKKKASKRIPSTGAEHKQMRTRVIKLEFRFTNER